MSREMVRMSNHTMLLPIEKRTPSNLNRTSGVPVFPAQMRKNGQWREILALEESRLTNLPVDPTM